MASGKLSSNQIFLFSEIMKFNSQDEDLK
jgi:hypothetical protein